ncbi:LysR family transcriptional regulator [Actinokineospora pegani]|uniref:LysR family transcriptional regulator n=1 Tax=Actinokineospora pegani TaxID=2654637 RepID=UPI0012EAEDCF|nr:LysR substrate-binding domain-containing protein [Actinokineospora pegani]
MELRQLEYFVAVVEEGGFTRGAARVHVAQPGVSAQVRRLERELGQELIDRSGKRVRLTEAGAAVLPYARAALEAVKGARLAVEELSGLVRGRVAVGAVTSHAVDVPGLLAAFHETYPAVEITLVEATSDELVKRLREGTLDAAVVSLGPVPPLDLEVVVVADEAITAGVAEGHPWAGRESVRLAELRDVPLVGLPPGTGVRSHLEAACAAAGFVPRVAFEAGDPAQVAALAVKGLGVAVLPDPVARSRPGLAPVAIVDPPLRGRLAFAWRGRGATTVAGRALVDMARGRLNP